VSPKIVGLLLAGGRGRRFDAAGSRDKLLQSLRGRPVAGHALDALAGGCDTVIAVLRPDAPAALHELFRNAGAEPVVCLDADEGLGHSLAAAVRAATAAYQPAAVLVMPADMPWVGVATVQAVARAARAGPADERAARIVVPRLADGRRGHPVAFGADHFAALAALTGDRGARALLDTLPLTVVATDDAGILRDVDTPSDLPPS
jgi:molybdenum cofactor cytidylyltransferase